MLKETRISRGLTQKQLAERVGCTRNMITMIENDVCNPSLGLLIKLAEALSCKLDDLVDRRELNEL